MSLNGGITPAPFVTRSTDLVVGGRRRVQVRADRAGRPGVGERVAARAPGRAEEDLLARDRIACALGRLRRSRRLGRLGLGLGRLGRLGRRRSRSEPSPSASSRLLGLAVLLLAELGEQDHGRHLRGEEHDADGDEHAEPLRRKLRSRARDDERDDQREDDEDELRTARRPIS